MNIKHGLFFSFALLVFSVELHASALYASDPTQNFLKAVDSYASTEGLEGLFRPINVNAVNEKGETPLIIFCRRGNQIGVEFMLSKNADPNVQQREHGYTALHAAASCLDPEIMNLLLKAGAHPNKQNNYGHTALHSCLEKHNMLNAIASRQDANRMAKTLIEHSDTNLDLTTVGNEGGKTALMLACSYGNNLMLRPLLAAGADIFIVDSYGNDAIALMEEKCAAERSVELAEKYMGMKEQLQEHREKILRITPQALAASFRMFMKKRNPEQGPSDMPLAVAKIIDDYIPKAKYSVPTEKPKCYPRCHCDNKSKAQPKLARAGAQAAAAMPAPEEVAHAKK